MRIEKRWSQTEIANDDKKYNKYNDWNDKASIIALLICLGVLALFIVSIL